MDDKTQKERLEQELRFLKESFEAEVISKEEFEKGKDRIEKKLKEIGQLAAQKINEEPKKEQITEQKKSEETKDRAIENKTEGKIKLKVIRDTQEDENFEPIQIKEQKKPEEPYQTKTELKEEKKESKFFKYAVVFVVLVLVALFSYSLLKGGLSKTQEKKETKFVAACSTNNDCKQEGKDGLCLNPGTKAAKCEFKDIQMTNVLVLNDRKNCFNCDTQRVISILEQWFGAINAKEIDYNTVEGKAIAEKFDTNALPMYILEENVTKVQSFEQFKKVFAKKENNYILNEDVAASNFYIKREKVPNKLDLFIIEGDTANIKAEKNLKEFLDTFKEVKFEKHLSNDNLTEELNIKTFPTFLVNNRVKFSGVHTAETIKENFCQLNKLEECEKSLSKSLV